MVKYMGRLLKNKKIKKRKEMKHQFNRTLHIIMPILVGKFSKFTAPPPLLWGSRRLWLKELLTKKMRKTCKEPLLYNNFQFLRFIIVVFFSSVSLQWTEVLVNEALAIEESNEHPLYQQTSIDAPSSLGVHPFASQSRWGISAVF